MPQGSILGPLLFLIYVYDIPMAVTCDQFLYADDTCLVFQSKNAKDMEKQLNEAFATYSSAYLGCILEETTSEESMVNKVVSKVKVFTLGK